MSDLLLRHFASVMEKLGDSGASDIHLTSDRGAYWVKDKATRRIDLKRPADALLDALIESEVNGGIGFFETGFQAAASLDFGGKYRGRFQVAKELGGRSGTIRLISREIPTAKSLDTPERVVAMGRARAGLLLFVGQTGSGKSTSIAAIENDRAVTTDETMITIEDPIEYVYAQDRTNVIQREVGLHTESFAAGVEDAKRRHPQVIIVGEIRNVETARAALLASVSGHLVVSTMHAGTTAEAIDSFTSMFTPEEQGLVRTQLAQSLIGIVAQQLVPKPKGGMVLAQEIALNTLTISDLISGGGNRSDATKFIRQALLSSKGEQEGQQSMEAGLARLVKEETIPLETAYRHARETSSLVEKLEALGVRPLAA